MPTDDDRSAKGGKARAEALSPERRSEIARSGAHARALKAAQDPGDGPIVLMRGSIKIGDGFELPCAVLSDGTRVITEQALATKLGRRTGGKTRRLAARTADDRPPLPDYLTTTIEQFVPDSLRLALTQPRLIPGRGGKQRAIDATLVPEVAEVWLKARDAGELQPSQTGIAENADLLMRALSRLGIIALVDEATGYQEFRAKDELQRILSAYINGELLPWTKRFPDDFYRELFRLRSWPYDPPSVKRPQLVGLLTNQLIYDQLPEGVLSDLKEKNPTDEKGRRKYKFHQMLTDDIGNPHLERQVAAVTTLMRASSTWNGFKKLFARAYPRKVKEGDQATLWTDDDDDE